MAGLRRTTYVPLVVVAALAVAGCGGNSSSNSSGNGNPNASKSAAEILDPVAAAASRTTKVTSSKLALDMTMRMPQLSQPIHMTATGAMDNVRKQGEMSIDMSEIAALAGTKIGDPSAWKGEEIFDGSNGKLVVYMRLPFLTQAAPGTKPWVKLDLAAMGRQQGINFSQFTQLSGDPTQQLDWLRATSGGVKKVGTATIRGEATTRYKATVDLAKYPRLVPPSRRAAMRRAIAAITNLSGLHKLPVEVWIGSDKLVRRMAMRFDETVQSQKLSMAMTIDLFDFGTKVHVTIPPASQTTDLGQLLGQ